MAAFVYDEFDDASLNAAWDIDVGTGSVAEANNRLEIACLSEDTHTMGQNFTTRPFDMWAKIEMDFTPDNDGDYKTVAQLKDDVSGDYVQIGLRWNVGDGPYWDLYVKFQEVGVGFEYVETQIDQSSIFVRLLWADAASNIRPFYSLVNPFHCEELVPTLYNPVLAGTDFSFSFISNGDQGATRTTWVWNATNYAKRGPQTYHPALRRGLPRRKKR